MKAILSLKKFIVLVVGLVVVAGFGSSALAKKKAAKETYKTFEMCCEKSKHPDKCAKMKKEWKGKTCAPAESHDEEESHDDMEG